MDANEALRTIQTLAYIALDNDSELTPARDRVDAMRRTLNGIALVTEKTLPRDRGATT
jgi:hypothetical protein